MALRPRQGEVRVHDPARDAPRLLPLRPVVGLEGRPRVLLVGAGHAHTLVLKRWADGGSPDVRLTVVTERPGFVYSGMIPGVVAEEYAVGDAVVDAAGLARRAGARCLVERAVEIDADRRRVRLADGTFVGYDVASLDIGATVPGPAGPGPPGSAISPRDVGGLEAGLRTLETGPRSPAVVVVGGGAAGVELAATIRARLGRRFPFENADRERGSGNGPSVTLVEGGPRIMGEYPDAVSRRVRRALEERGVGVRTDESVERIDGSRDEAGAAARSTEEEAGTTRDASDATGKAPDRAGEPATLVLSSGDRLTSHLTVWATGAAAPPLLRGSELPTDEEGFVLVDERLLVRGRDDLFAVGDCARFRSRELPKAGVHAVRQAPVLLENLRRTATGRGHDLRSYEPQKDFLTLLNLGDRTALGTKWGLTVEGRWVRWLKDAIDRRFVEGLRDPG